MTELKIFKDEKVLNEVFWQLSKINSIPMSGTENVTCCDCGREVIAAHCTWEVSHYDPKDKSFIIDSGPHCGCKSAKRAKRKRGSRS